MTSRDNQETGHEDGVLRSSSDIVFGGASHSADVSLSGKPPADFKSTSDDSDCKSAESEEFQVLRSVQENQPRPENYVVTLQRQDRGQDPKRLRDPGLSPEKVRQLAIQKHDEVVGLKTKLRKLEEENVDMQRTIDTSNDYMKIQNTTIDSLRKQNAELQTNLSCAKNEVAVLQTNLNSTKHDLSCAKNEVAVLQTDLNSTKHEVVVLQTDLTATKDEVDMLKSSLSSAKNEVSMLQSDLNSTKDEVHRTKSEVVLLENQLSTTTIQMKEWRDTASELADELSAAKHNGPNGNASDSLSPTLRQWNEGQDPPHS